MGSTRIAPPADPGGPLVDRQRRVVDYLRVSVTDRCNYRCTYCLPDEGVAHALPADQLGFDEIAALVTCFVELGVKRVRLTGGEPTARKDLVSLVARLRTLAGLEELALSTNGHLLPELAAPLREAGVDRLNISVDTLDPGRFAQITRRGDLARVLAGIEAARAAGFPSIKINTVAIKGFNDHEIEALCAFAWERDLVPRFIEQMPMAAGALFVPGTLMSAAEIRARLTATQGGRLVPHVGGAAAGAGPARYWRLEPATSAELIERRPRLVGIISAMTEHFCDTCNRVRLSSSGELHTCLAHDDAVDLRGRLHRDGPPGVMVAIRQALGEKRDGHTFQLVGLGGPRKTMIQIGG